MKNILFIATIAGTLLAGCGNHISESKLPSVVVNAVKAKYNPSNNIEWEKTSSGYEAEVMTGRQEITVLVDGNGNIVMQKEGIQNEELPATITTALSATYKDHQLDEAEKLEKDGVTYYQVEMDGKASQKELELVFTADGRPATNIAYWK